MAIRPEMEDTYRSGVLSQGRYEKVLEGVGVSCENKTLPGRHKMGDFNKDTWHVMVYSPHLGLCLYFV